MGNNIEKNHIARVTYEKTLRASPNKKAAKPLPYKPSPRREGGLRQRRSGAFVCRTNAPLFPCTTNCLSCHSHPIRPCGAPSPRGEGCDTRIPSSKKVVKLPPYNKAPSTSVGMTGGRLVISHSLSHRFVDPSCAFGAALLQGPTRIVYNTDSSKTRNVSPS